MKIAYHMPNPDSLNAYRTIYNGFKNAFFDLGHEFSTFTANDNLADFLEKNKPDIFFTATHFYYKKFLDFDLLKKYRDLGMKVFVKIDFWDSPMNKGRINEAKSLKDDIDTVKLIKKELYGDIFYHVVEQGDGRMKGFEAETGYKYHTIPLAADKIVLKDIFEERFKVDISFIGTYLPQKKDFFNSYLFPLKNRYNTRIYGQDWSFGDRFIGLVQKIGQFFNIPIVKSLRKPKLQLEDEGKIYKSSLVSVNIHEDYQRKFGGDCNERTFKIPLCGGFEIVDGVACIGKYFKEGEEIIIAKDEKDWFEKIDYYIKNPEKRLPIIEAGKKRVLAEHTYHNRVEQIMGIYNSIKK
ncbi:MAG: glycosyltransferase [Patescibacteria group bacterium]|nr:glycosyltransferase [Patescibacteria group bacterium]